MGPKRAASKVYGPNKRQAHFEDLPFFDTTSSSLLPANNYAMSGGWVPNHLTEPEPLIARNPPPSSQKAATMTVEPSTSAIEQVMAFTNASYDIARRFLKVKRNDANAAATAIWEEEDINKLEQSETWDEGAWGADRDGSNQQLVPLGTSAAPTRRPSPAPSLGLQNPKTQADEDAEFERALLMSKDPNANFDAMSFQQETGVRKADGTESKFGPATKKEYEEGQWGMIKHGSQEVIPDVPARERKHVPFEPRILKHLADGDYTPNLLSICHAIPKAKEALLMREYAKNDYRYDADWWRGHPIAMPRIVHTTDGSLADPNADKYDEFITEVQRLMAVLDRSDRSYATIGALTQVELIRDTDLSSKPGSLLELVLHSWISAASSKLPDPHANEQISGVFNTLVGTTAQEGMETPNLTAWDLSVKTSGDRKTDLSELMDNLLWDTTDDTDMSDNYIERPADVLVVRLSQVDPAATQLGVDVPATLALDKYVKENVDVSRAVRQKMAQGKKRVAKIEQIEKKLKEWQHPTKSTQLDAQQLLRHTLGHFSGQNRRDADKADTTNNASLASHEPPEYSEIAAKLEKVIASVDEKLQMLAEQKEFIRKTISEMSKAPLPGLDSSAPEHRYTLRGVATKPNISYILQKRDPADDAPPPSDDGTPDGFEWWRVDYEVAASSAKITTTRAADFDVLRAVELEHNSALLVYASDEACSLEDYDHEGLPVGLIHFVALDNLQLQKEIDSADEEAVPPAYSFDVPRASIERRDSMDSMGPNMPDSPTQSSELPHYMDDHNVRQHSGFGLGYDVKAGQSDADDVHEIHLPPATDRDLLSGEVTTTTREIEMVEKAHSPLIPQTADVDMGGVESQDGGVGGTPHLEDRVMKR